MIAGFILCTVLASKLLEPFSMAALVRCTSLVGLVCTSLTALSLFGLDSSLVTQAQEKAAQTPFAQALRLVWGDPLSRRFAVFVTLSMLAYSTQDLILEPFAGAVFHLSPADSTRVSGLHQTGALLGMLLAAALSTRVGTLGGWARWGCAGSGAALVLVALSPALGLQALQGLKASLLLLGVCNGAFSIGAIGSMMSLSASGEPSLTGVRMGVFGAAQAVAMAAGGVLGAGLSDVLRALSRSDRVGYGGVFLLEAGLFVVAAWLASAARDAGKARSTESLLASAGG
jgi:BCD family chlorophyll transporter-like MFS transporter